MKTIRHSLLTIATFLPVLTACRSDAPANAADAPVQVAAVAPAEVVIRTRDNVFHEAPDTLTAGLTNIRLINEGPSFHHVWLVRLEDGHTVTELVEAFKAGGPPPSWAIDVGGPNAPGAPGGETAAIVDLEPGTYALLCVVDVPDGIPHVMKGMAREVVVVPGTGQAATLPEADIVMTLNDYTFDTNVPITVGRHTIRVENAADQPHEVLIVKLNEGATAEEFMAAMAAQQGPPPGTVLGGITGIANGGMNQVTLEFEQGDYALICFVPDASDGRPHFMHGMLQQVHVM
ncbi:MAG TPA: hypothetical protein VHG09_08215 [Longimicrobiales bacterium]|nr:hypothetical protein [Longimicrobiales bacterium]